ncbi:MAG: CoA transferase, partial [Gammaproteobacteria bacterium]|nr:CoA transferase [Gammaproteobacteria bacterium]
VLGPTAAEYKAAGKVRTRTGSRSTNSAPRGCYETRDGQWIAVSASTPKMAQKFLASYASADLLQEPRFASNEARVQHAAELDEVISAAIREKTLQENMQLIRSNGLTAHPVQSIRDIENDPHWQALDLIVDVADGDASVRMHNVVPRFSQTPGQIRWPGAALGAHNEEIYCGELGLSTQRLAELHDAGVI